ncbi:MAG: 16S rRNA (guanine(527)-N(7))-methyltransferase RsmG [Sulfitobacter sp.]|jgi:16S rRNA (guanine527-N7)-methyltransferase|nr:16S rRNA (guanine(527)-N(7))-methyltransferase RsmG [Sulfitobacter sp.]
MTPDDLNVSRETLDKLQAFADLVQKWTSKINLISKPSVPEVWDRHILDSAQLYDLAPSSGHWIDLGSGGGFPGIVVCILAQGQGADQTFTLVESDQRKSTFLRTAIRELSLDARVLTQRIEEIAPMQADILSARALADLDALLGFAEMHLKPGGTALLPKGAQWEKEHRDAQIQWSYDCDPIKSKTNPDAAILKIKDIARV